MDFGVCEECRLMMLKNVSDATAGGDNLLKRPQSPERRFVEVVERVTGGTQSFSEAGENILVAATVVQ